MLRSRRIEFAASELAFLDITYWITGIILLILYFGHPNAVPDFRPDQQNDPFSYISLAKSLLRGDGYPTKHWLPGFPFLLSGAISAFGMDFWYLKLSMVGVALFAVVWAYRLFEDVCGHVVAWPLAILLAATPVFFDYSHRLMSETPFLATSLLACVALVELQKHFHGRRATVVWTFLLVVASAGAVLIRGNALALIPALITQFAMMRRHSDWWNRYSCGFALVILLLTYSAWLVRSQETNYSGINNVTYLQEIQAENIGELWDAGGFKEGVRKIDLPGLVKRIYRNIAWYHSYQVASLLVPGANQLASVKLAYIGLILSILLCSPAIVGYFVLLKRSAPLACYLAGSLALVVIYPTGGSPRMLLPSIPLLLAAVFLGIQRLFGSVAARVWLCMAIFLAIIQCAMQAKELVRHPYSYDEFANFLSLVQTDLDRLANPGEVVVAPTSHSEVIQAFTSLKTVALHEALKMLESERIETFLQIAGPSETQKVTDRIPEAIMTETIARRGAFNLLRLSSSSDLPRRPVAAGYPR